jgi:(p)ppGpp synthase/HD superfamily hydrolase
MLTLEQTKTLVQSRILGNRIGCDVPNYLHSWRVYDALVRWGFAEETCIAGLLHDIIEDSETTMDELSTLGYSENILHLVDLATHDVTITDSFTRRQTMIQRLIDADDREARAIKLADISDNFTECHLLKPHNFETFLNKKAPVFVYFGNHFFWGTPFYTEFVERYFTQVKKLYQYF